MNQKVYDKYVRKYDPNAPENIAKAKEQKRQRRRQWWSANWITFSSLLVAIIALAVSVIALLK